jgi:carnitine 3-dehydrogenase
MALEKPPVAKAAVFGCGTVGAAWAALFSAAGIEVAVHDPAIASSDQLEARVAPLLPALRKLGMHGRGSLVLADSAAAACQDAEFVGECIREDVAEKAALLAELDAAAPGEAIIASSTSSLLWSDLVSRSQTPERIIVSHPFNPAHLMPLVELYGASAEVVGRAHDFFRSLGKTPIILRREAQGHVANRLSSALFREAVHLVIEGIASVEDVDIALREGPGLRWSVLGVHQGYHLGAGPGGIRAYLEHLGASQQRRWDDLGAPELTPEVCETLIGEIERTYGAQAMEGLEAKRDQALILRLMERRR